ncbi:MAG: hypothetical protein WCY41_03875 [Candidatus Micrarchaeia archaeon]
MPGARYGDSDCYISLLGNPHCTAVSAFESDKEELNDFLAKDALGYQNLNLGATYLLFSKEGNRLISYITLSMGALKIPEGDEFEFRGKRLKEYPKEFPRNFPALLIGKLATDKREETRGGASLLLAYAASKALQMQNEIGCAYLMAHVYTDKIEWYMHKGFRTFIADPSKMETVPMYIEL